MARVVGAGAATKAPITGAWGLRLRAAWRSTDSRAGIGAPSRGSRPPSPPGEGRRQDGAVCCSCAGRQSSCSGRPRIGTLRTPISTDWLRSGPLPGSAPVGRHAWDDPTGHRPVSGPVAAPAPCRRLGTARGGLERGSGPPRRAPETTDRASAAEPRAYVVQTQTRSGGVYDAVHAAPRPGLRGRGPSGRVRQSNAGRRPAGQPSAGTRVPRMRQRIISAQRS